MHIKNRCRWHVAIYMLIGLPATAAVTGTGAEQPVDTTDYLVSENNSETSRNNPAHLQAAPSPLQTHSVEDYQREVERIETEYGAYGGQLSEYLVGLAVAFQEQGEHGEAIDAFKRAMHINRINEGLYSLNQVPIIEKMIESYVAQGDWEDANDKHHYLYWLHRRNFGAEDPRMLPVIDKLSNWHLNAYALDMGSGLFYHLINAHRLFNLAVNIIANTYGENDLRLIDALRGLTVSNYYLATYKGVTQPNFQLRTAGGMGANTASEEQKARLEQYINNSYNSGKRAISRMVNIYANNPDSQPWAEAKAKVELGDWYLLFNKWQSALAIYQESHDFMLNHNVSKEQINELFGHPVALPDLPLVDSAVVKEDKEQSYVLVSFDVTAYGRARNIDILESNPEDNVRIRSRVRKALKIAKFRPRFEKGAPALTTNITHRYLFADDK